MDVRPLGNGIALEVRGLRIWEPLPESTACALARLWSQNGLLVFRRQALDEDELAAFSERFGELDVIVRTDWQSPNRPEVTQISNLKDAAGRSIGGLGAGELGWHSDQSYMARPATGSLLYMVEKPRFGGRTQWANLSLAYAGLPGPLKQAAEGRHAVFDYVKRQSTYDDEAPMPANMRARTPKVAHSLVNVHPVTGARALYLDPATTVGVLELPGDEGEALLDSLNAHATGPEYVYSHDWQVGDVVMWDNALVLHRRDPFDSESHRLLKRTTFRLPAARHILPQGFAVDA